MACCETSKCACRCLLNTSLCTSLQEAVAHATIDDELAADPETAKQIDQEISEGNFIP